MEFMFRCIYHCISISSQMLLCRIWIFDLIFSHVRSLCDCSSSRFSRMVVVGGFASVCVQAAAAHGVWHSHAMLTHRTAFCLSAAGSTGLHSPALSLFDRQHLVLCRLITFLTNSKEFSTHKKWVTKCFVIADGAADDGSRLSRDNAL